MLQLSDFMCTCSDEQRKLSEDCYERVTAELTHPNWPPDLLTGIVFSLQWGLGDDYYGTIDGIRCDQWSVVRAIVYKYADGGSEDYAHISVQCDRIEHGVARVWELAKEAVGIEKEADW